MKTTVILILLHKSLRSATALHPKRKIPTPNEKSNLRERKLDNSSSLSNEKIDSTDKCRDSSQYLSPLNGLWTCEDHSTIPCEKFIHLGLNETGLEVLLASCPESCNSTCTSTSTIPSAVPKYPERPLQDGKNVSLLIEFDIFLHNENELLNESEKAVYQQVSLDYLRSLFREKDGEEAYKYYLKSFTINSQSFVEHQREYLRRQLSKSITTLKIVATLAFESSSSLLRENLLIVIHLAVDSDDYSEILRKHIDLDEVEISSSYEAGLDQKPTQTNGIDAYMLGAAIVAILTSLLFIAAMIFAVIFHRRRRHLKHFTNLSPQKQQHQLSEEMNFDAMNKIKISSCNEKHIDELIMNNFKLKVDEFEMKNRRMRFNQESKSVQQQRESKGAIIPPMIVIDNIDDNVSNASPMQTSLKNVDPCNDREERAVLMNVTNLDTSRALAISLSANQTTRNPLQPTLLLNECLPQQSNTESEKGSPLSLLSSRPSIGETASIISTPASSNKRLNNKSFPSCMHEHKNSVFSFNPDIDMEPEDDFTVLFEKKMKEGGKTQRSFNFKDLFKRNRASDEERSSGQVSHYESDAEVSEMSSVVRRNDRLLGQLNSPSIGSENDYSVDHGNNISLTENDYPETTPKSNNEETPSNTSEEDCTSSDSLQPWLLYTFEAPISGKLGMIIQSAKNLTRNAKYLPSQSKLIQTGPTVLKIKGYSPLLGMVKPGDIIVSVDDINTQRMSTTEITTLLESKRCQSDDSKIKISVISKEVKPFEPEPSEHILTGEDLLESPSYSKHDLDEDNDDSPSSSESDGTFHLIDTGMSDDDDDESFHMMAGSEEFM